MATLISTAKIIGVENIVKITVDVVETGIFHQKSFFNSDELGDAGNLNNTWRIIWKNLTNHNKT